jgi:PAS domain S-box-containing protein
MPSYPAARVAIPFMIWRSTEEGMTGNSDTDPRVGPGPAPSDEFQRLLETIPAGAYTCDLDGLITYFNRHAAALWGRSPALNDPIDRYCGSFKLFAKDGTPISHDQCWMALALRENREYNGHEIIVERPTGERLTVLAHANPIRDQDGTIIGAVNVLVDISDRKQVEDALKAADRSKNHFLATLAHELRNPLAPICSAIQMLKHPGTPESERQWALDLMDRQVRQMTRLIDDLVDVARITANRLELRRERVDLADVLRSAAEVSRPLIEARRHRLVMALPAQTLQVDGDPTRLEQVVSNLLNNAAKFTDPGGHIWLTADREGQSAVVTVRDSGVGLSSDMLPYIFELFNQIEQRPRGAHEGLGIGLNLARRLVEMHGGTITASSPGIEKGSLFTVRLPALDASATKSPTLRSGLVTGPRLRILVVDDHKDVADSSAALLRIMGHETYTANDGLEAVEKAEEIRPDVVLLDIGLPTIDGYEAARRIREQPWSASLVLIAVTGWGQPMDRQRSKDAGFDHHLIKPVETATLARLLATIPLSSTTSNGHGTPPA